MKSLSFLPALYWNQQSCFSLGNTYLLCELDCVMCHGHTLHDRLFWKQFLDEVRVKIILISSSRFWRFVTATSAISLWRYRCFFFIHILLVQIINYKCDPLQQKVLYGFCYKLLVRHLYSMQQSLQVKRFNSLGKRNVIMYANVTVSLTLVSNKLEPSPFSQPYPNGIKNWTALKCQFEETVPKMSVNSGNRTWQVPISRPCLEFPFYGATTLRQMLIVFVTELLYLCHW